MEVAPILANSTTTPALRFATSSMNAGGNDHSRPDDKTDGFCHSARVTG